jgi:serine O-acetyltransferase
LDVLDPEVGIDIVNLGLIKEINVEGGIAKVDMVLTSKTCPLADHLTEQVKRRAEGIPGIEKAVVKVLDEPWNWDRFIEQQFMHEQRAAHGRS